MNYKHEAIYILYPEVVVIREKEAFDSKENIVEYDEDSVADKALKIEAEFKSAAQAKIEAHQSALNKLMALGLTEEEALALGVK